MPKKQKKYRSSTSHKTRPFYEASSSEEDLDVHHDEDDQQYRYRSSAFSDDDEPYYDSEEESDDNTNMSSSSNDGQMILYHHSNPNDHSSDEADDGNNGHHHNQLVLFRPYNSTRDNAVPAVSLLSKGHIAQAIQLLNSAYGTIDDPDFPLPMRPAEAGPSKFIWGKSKLKQRRYLWTDSFAVLAYQTLAEYYAYKGDREEAKYYLNAVKKIIWVVHETLGRPRSSKERDAMKLCDFGEPISKDASKKSKAAKKYVGLRIGKVQSRKVTDDGSTYDGQYWHHIEKWLFALARTNHVTDGIWIAKSCFPYFFQFGRTHGSIRSKISVDTTPPSPSASTNSSNNGSIGPNNNNLNALVVFTMLESRNTNKDVLSLQDEIALLQSSLKNYCPSPISDPVEWGMEAIFDQFIKGHPRTEHWHFSDFSTDMFNPTNFTRPYRMYGALIGALVHGSVVPPDRLGDLLDSCIQYHQWRGMEGKDYQYATLDRTMLAVAFLSPGIFVRRISDPLVRI